MTDQGWECPICHHVYSPVTAICLYCPAVIKTVSDSSENSDISFSPV